MILAGIDIGTNSLRLLVAEAGPDSLHSIFSDRRTTRLGKDLERTGRLSRDSAERSVGALVEFAGRIRQLGVFAAAAIGTSALRKASNSPDFIAEVKDRAGLDIRVISGEDEARLTLLGVMKAISARERKNGAPQAASVIIDIGGGSTELIMDRRGAEPVIASLSLGAVYLAERFIKHDPPTAGELEALRRAVRAELDVNADLIQPGPDALFIGTAGTISTLAAIDQGRAEYLSDMVHGSVLTGKFIDTIVQKLSAFSLAERRTIHGLEHGREDIIMTGAVVAQEIMRRFGQEVLLVSEWGLREGIVFELYGKIAKRSAAEKPVRRERGSGV